MKVDLFQYNLPEELIAQYPAEKRDGSRLLVVHRDTGIIEHRGFPDICEYIHKNDVLVLNDSKVIHARLLGVKRATDAAAEIFLIRAETAPGTFRSSGFDGASGTGGASGGYGLGTVWEVLAKPSKRLKPGEIVDFSDDFAAEMLGGTEDGNRFVRFFHKDASGQEISAETDLTETFDRLGKMPLPPYIRRQANETDEIRYQTVYSRIPGSVAAPTAGLHFTEETLAALRAKGAATAFVTLHVGLGTFRPVKVD
ncbi:MAG: S-adenosylmethionine:tRNA ribosyltransferase-isomerase, partial [Clostridiales Family XIII bacterium]|nr:S-adenosylmethionine:tRNA ribosyltransferase-isomerase [Clostridiales Family XIII bacterium]